MKCQPGCVCKAHRPPRAIIALLPLFAVLWQCTPLAAQYNRKPPVNVEQLTVKDGLSQNVVYGISQDSKGFIWIATFNGLDRYDGYEFLHFRHSDRDLFSVSTNYISYSLEDSRQRLWIATYGSGLNYFDKNTRRFYHFLPRKTITKLAEDAAGDLWGCDNTYIVHISIAPVSIGDKSKLPFIVDTAFLYLPDFSMLTGGISCVLYTDARKNVYASTPIGLYLLSFNKEKHQIGCTLMYAYRYNKLSDYGMAPPAFFEDAATKKYYISTCNGVFESRNPRFADATKVHDPIPYFASVYLDRQGRLWYNGDEATHTFNVRTGEDKIMGRKRAEADFFFYSLIPKLQDTNGTLWMTTISDGIIKYSDDENHFHTLLPGVYTGRITLWNDNEVIANEAYKISIGKKETAIAKQNEKDVAFSQNYHCLSFADGSKWWIKDTLLICENKLLHKRNIYPIPYRLFSPQKGITPAAGNKPAKDTLYSQVTAKNMFLDRDSCLWLYCYRGFVYYDIKKDSFHFTDTGTDARRNYQDINGTMWMGTDSGACSYNKETGVARLYNWRADGDIRSLVSRTVTSFCDDPLDPQRFIWIGTRNGLSRMEKSTGICRNFTGKDGLPDNIIYAILSDNSGNLWISSNGLCRMNVANFSIRNFYASDGLQGNEFNTGAAAKMPGGTLLFGGTNGLNYFHPDEITPLPPPQTVLTDCKVFGKSLNLDSATVSGKDIAYAKNISISYKDNIVSFSFAGVDYRKTHYLQYRYKLIGFDKNWNYAGSAHEATYTNLDPGDYTFVAEAGNTNGVWGKESNGLRLHVLPLWWQTWWFKILLAGTVVSIIYSAYRYRVQQVLRLERVRNNIARDLHDEIGSALSTISIYSSIAQQHSDKPEANPYLLMRKINENAVRVMEAMSDIVWSINTQNDKFENIISRMQEYAFHLLEVKGYTVHFSFDEQLDQKSFGPEKRKNFYLIYKEALNNIVKYAEGANVWIRIADKKSSLTLVIKDDGRGFESTGIKKNGNGLTNMQSRAAGIGGEIVLLSSAGAGTEIRVVIPYK